MGRATFCLAATHDKPSNAAKKYHNPHNFFSTQIEKTTKSSATYECGAPAPHNIQLVHHHDRVLKKGHQNSTEKKNRIIHNQMDRRDLLGNNDNLFRDYHLWNLGPFACRTLHFFRQKKSITRKGRDVVLLKGRHNSTGHLIDIVIIIPCLFFVLFGGSRKRVVVNVQKEHTWWSTKLPD